MILFEEVEDPVLELFIDLITRTPLLVIFTLEVDLLPSWKVDLVGEDTVAPRDLIDPGGAVTNPLTSHKDGHLNMESEIDLLKGGGVFVTHQVVD